MFNKEFLREYGVISIIFSILIGLVFLILLYNTSVIEVGRQSYGTVLYKSCISGHYYVTGGDISGDAIIEDSAVPKVIDNIQNQYYVIREYSGLLYWKKDIIINVIQ